MKATTLNSPSFGVMDSGVACVHAVAHVQTFFAVLAVYAVSLIRL